MDIIEKNTHAYEQQHVAKKYTETKAENYYRKHKSSWYRRLVNSFEQRMAMRALKMAGNPKNILDFPCGAGRFWPTLSACTPDLKLYAADYNLPMINTALKYNTSTLIHTDSCFAGSIYSIPLIDNAVENIFCMRYLHHVGHTAERMKLLKELCRVTTDTACISLYVDGSLKSFLWQLNEKPSTADEYLKEYVTKRSVIENEFIDAGFEIIGHTDILKGIFLWRTYVLRKKANRNQEHVGKPLSELIACPVCKGKLITHSNHLSCEKDQLVFALHNGIPDLVVNRANPLS